MEQDPEFTGLQQAVWNADDPTDKWFAVKDLEAYLFAKREPTAVTDGNA